MSLPLCVRLDADDELGADTLAADGWRSVETLETWLCQIAYPIAEKHGFDIRKLRLADRGACHHILSHHRFDRLHMDVGVPDVLADFTRDAWLEKAFDGDGLSLVAEKDMAVLGFVTAYPYQDGHRIGFLAVREDCQGRGIAKALVRDVIRRVKTVLYAGTQSHNEAARGLYASLGFECIQRQRTYHKGLNDG